MTTASTPLPCAASAAPYAANGIRSTSALPAGWAGSLLSSQRTATATSRPVDDAHDDGQGQAARGAPRGERAGDRPRDGDLVEDQ